MLLVGGLADWAFSTENWPQLDGHVAHAARGQVYDIIL